nr:LOW QUALITY PROTEIN: solute carrier family 43 member 3 [Pelodiscus sinensis]|eukprot:XP_025038117.1 LOW QUALITY PROTEIN: solute carrier family 43 member 3 [Pelodiscus sinensis]
MEGQGAVLAKRLATLLSGLLECMCFAGVIFGWASLVFVLKDMHYFEELCVPAANGTGNGTQGPGTAGEMPEGGGSAGEGVGSAGEGWGSNAESQAIVLSHKCVCVTHWDSSRSRIVHVPACACACVVHTGGVAHGWLCACPVPWARSVGCSSLTRGACVPPAATALILFPAMCLLSVGGILFILTNMQVGNLFGKHRSTIITLYNGAFDSSSAIFLLVKESQGRLMNLVWVWQDSSSLQSTGAGVSQQLQGWDPRREMAEPRGMLGMSGDSPEPLRTLAASFLAGWPRAQRQLLELSMRLWYGLRQGWGTSSRGLPAMFLFLSACSIWHLTRTFFLMPRWHIPYPLPSGYTYGLRCERQGCSSHLHEEEPSNPRVEPGPGDADARKALKGNGESGAGPGHGEQQPAKSFRACVFSKLFFWHLMWLSVMQLRHYLFIGTPNPLLTNMFLGCISKMSTYTNAFAFTQLCGVLCAPWNGLILDRHKRGKTKEGSAKGAVDPLADLRSCVLSLAVTALQCVAFSVCASVPVLPVQYVTFILQVLSRSFLYGGNAAFLAIAFPLEHFGKLYGLVMGLSAVVSLLQYPCFALVKGPLGDDPFYVNIGLNIVILLAFVSPLVVLRECRRRAKEQDEPRADPSPTALHKAGVESSI